MLLTIVEGEDSGRVVPLPEHDAELGRGDPKVGGDDRINFAESTVSVSQALLKYEPNRRLYRICNAGGATNRTRVNGRSVRRERILKEGDVIRMGRTVVVFGRAGASVDLTSSIAGTRDGDKVIAARTVLVAEEDPFLRTAGALPDLGPPPSPADERALFKREMVDRIREAWPRCEISEKSTLELFVVRDGRPHEVDLEALFYLCRQPGADRELAISSFLRTRLS